MVYGFQRSNVELFYLVSYSNAFSLRAPGFTRKSFALVCKWVSERTEAIQSILYIDSNSTTFRVNFLWFLMLAYDQNVNSFRTITRRQQARNRRRFSALVIFISRQLIRKKILTWYLRFSNTKSIPQRAYFHSNLSRTSDSTAWIPTRFIHSLQRSVK